MGSARVRLRLCLCGAAAIYLAVSLTAQAKKKADQPSDDVPMATVFGSTGERYIFYGTNGITVDQSPRPGILRSNLSTYHIRIDGSGISPAGNPATSPVTNLAATSSGPAAVSEDADFSAASNCSYFVSGSVTCTLPTASGIAGSEIKICNTGNGSKIAYNTRYGETISGNLPGAITNSTPYRVDRFLSDGKNWYKE